MRPAAGNAGQTTASASGFHAASAAVVSAATGPRTVESTFLYRRFAPDSRSRVTASVTSAAASAGVTCRESVVTANTSASVSVGLSWSSVVQRARANCTAVSFAPVRSSAMIAMCGLMPDPPFLSGWWSIGARPRA